MKPKEWFEDQLKKYKDDPEYKLEGEILELQETIIEFAKAVNENWFATDSEIMGFPRIYVCIFCKTGFWWHERPIMHRPDCIVLKAQKILGEK